MPDLVAVDVLGGGAPPREIEVVLSDGVRVRVAHDVSLERLVAMVQALRNRCLKVSVRALFEDAG